MSNKKLFSSIFAICTSLLWQHTALTAPIPKGEEYDVFFHNSSDIAITIIHMEACRSSWNRRIRLSDPTDPLLIKEPIGKKFVLGTTEGMRFSYNIDSAPGIDICGWYFIPDGNTPVEYLESQAHAQAINKSMPILLIAAEDINKMVPDDQSSCGSQIAISCNEHFMTAVDEYQYHLVEEKAQHRLQDDKNFYKEFPTASDPDIRSAKGEMPATWATTFGKGGPKLWSLFQTVAEDLRAFDKF